MVIIEPEIRLISRQLSGNCMALVQWNDPGPVNFCGSIAIVTINTMVM